MLIEVTQKHIDDAYNACFNGDSDVSLTHCMVALALKDVFPNEDIEVAYSYVLIGPKHILLPKYVIDKIFTFMDGKKPDAFSFQLNYTVAP